MSVLEIERVVSKLPVREKQQLSLWLLECLEDEADEVMVRRALEEGGKPVPWEQLKKEYSILFKKQCLANNDSGLFTLYTLLFTASSVYATSSPVTPSAQ